MGMEEKLSEEVLQGISGGAASQFEEKRAQFEAAWDSLQMTKKGFSGMRMAQIFDEWEMSGYKPEAIVFLAQYK